VLFGKDNANKNKGKPKPKGGVSSGGGSSSIGGSSSSGGSVVGSSPKVRARNQAPAAPAAPEPRGAGGLRPLSGAATRQRSWDSARDWVAPQASTRDFSPKGDGESVGPDGLALPPPELQCEHFKACWGCAFERGLATTPVMVQAKALLSLEVGRVRAQRSPLPLTSISACSSI
jgi:hypothetical protein